MGVTYDTGALIAAEKGDRRMWALHAGFLALGVSPVVPAPVLAQAWKGGGRQAHLSRLLALCRIEEMDEAVAKEVGVLATRAGHGDVIDVMVVAGAVRRLDGVVTSDPDDITRVARALGVALAVTTV